MSFDSLGLSQELLRAVKQQGYTTPTAIQMQSIPAVLNGGDVMASAQTGTGKTAAFTLPMLQRVNDGAERQRTPRVRALVLTPTRELAAQVQQSVSTYGRYLPIRAAEIYGGAPMGKQTAILRRGVDIVVATPGRLIDHLERGNVQLGGVDILVLDEADRMLDMGFKPAIERIVKTLPAHRQTLLFSATFSGAVRGLAQRFLNAPQLIEMGGSNAAAEAVEQAAYLVDSHRKSELLSHLIGSRNWHQVLVFTRTKRGADRLAEQLERAGIRAQSIHGDKSQGQRGRALNAFKRRSVRALVATDVAARGLDITGLANVVNYDLPNNPDDYVHRIGRTGRGGDHGSAWSFVGGDERRQLQAIQRTVKADIPLQVLEGFEPTQRRRSGPPPSRRSGPPPRRPSAAAGRSTSSRGPGGPSGHSSRRPS
ncbi:ATP-dependent RNA helicase RhlE [Halorhodospira abdelmalekii]|uniref:DEAD/DEAH box helicase n=1 Tax=Halorhodospira abdelmalekii TaxID=421629 RepID=UPI0019089334|nr:DEAD/DEAH box helicase [Halorhodospira abdelmalekii]MBK1735259.1 ATP-dependent RNA helicase RhlE [Halorhodospira abdelmalekii]